MFGYKFCTRQPKNLSKQNNSEEIAMNKVWKSNLLLILVLVIVCGTLTFAQETVNLRAKLVGFQENPPKLTQGTGQFTAVVNTNANTIAYTLTYSNLTSGALFSHIHFGQPTVNGAVYIFLCGGPTTPVCPAGGGTVTGTISAADVLGVPAQNIAAGDFAGALRVILNDSAYVNVHTTAFPAGEIRGQVRFGGEGETARHEASDHSR
jgi:CHRD domain-containing protein